MKGLHRPELAPEQVRGVAQEVVRCLGETDDRALRQIAALVKNLGVSSVKVLLKDAIEVNEKEGMKTKDGTRQRTLGGIFFELAIGRHGRIALRDERPPKKKTAPKMLPKAKPNLKPLGKKKRRIHCFHPQQTKTDGVVFGGGRSGGVVLPPIGGKKPGSYRHDRHS